MKQKVAEIFNLIFGFRKFLLMLALFAVGIVFRVKGYLDGNQFVDLLKGTTISFFAANGVEHIVRTVSAVMGKETPTEPTALADTDESNDEKELDLK